MAATQSGLDEFFVAVAWAQDPFLMLARIELALMTRDAVGTVTQVGLCYWLADLNECAAHGGREAW